MKIVEKNGIRIGTPDYKGGFLTQSYDIDIENRVLTDKLFLAVNDSKDNWKDITAQEAEEIRAEKQVLIEEKSKELNEI